jgi:membrane fusion protein (multidrug efflux system)
MAKKIIYPLVAILGIAAASGVAWWVQSKPKLAQEMGGSAPVAGPAGAASAASPRPAGVEVAQAEVMPLRDDAQSVGSLRSSQSVMMRPEVAGRIKSLGFSDGAQVRKGQVLVQLDDTLQQAEVSQAMAQVSIAKATNQRNKELVAQNFVAQRVLEESAAVLQVAEAQLALANARLSRMAILAPFNGSVGIRNVNVGDYVKDGADLVNIEDISSMYVDFRLPERFQGKLKLNQTVELALDAFPGRAFKARIQALDPLLDVNGRSVGVRALLPNVMGEMAQKGKPQAVGVGDKPAQVAAAGKDKAARPADAARAGNVPNPLRPGMFARVNTVFGVNDAAVVVPEEAIVPQGGRQFVIKVVAPSALPAGATANLPADTKFVSLRQEVKLGVRRQGKVEILEGLSPGQTVVVAGQQRLQRDGSPLRIVEVGRPQQGAASAPVSGASAPAIAASR